MDVYTQAESKRWSVNRNRRSMKLYGKPDRRQSLTLEFMAFIRKSSNFWGDSNIDIAMRRTFCFIRLRQLSFAAPWRRNWDLTRSKPGVQRYCMISVKRSIT